MKQLVPYKEGHCEGCGIEKEGLLYGEVLIEYREHLLCSWCIRNWGKLEEKYQRTIEFEEYWEGVKG